jgi:hypothetical protein
MSYIMVSEIRYELIKLLCPRFGYKFLILLCPRFDNKFHAIMSSIRLYISYVFMSSIWLYFFYLIMSSIWLYISYVYYVSDLILDFLCYYVLTFFSNVALSILVLRSVKKLCRVLDLMIMTNLIFNLVMIKCLLFGSFERPRFCNYGVSLT